MVVSQKWKAWVNQDVKCQVQRTFKSPLWGGHDVVWGELQSHAVAVSIIFWNWKACRPYLSRMSESIATSPLLWSMIRHYRKKEGRKIGVEKGHTGFTPRMLSQVDTRCDSASVGACHRYLCTSGELGRMLLEALWLSCALFQWRSTGQFGLHLALTEVASLVLQGLHWEKSASPAAQGFSEGDGSAPVACQQVS